MSASDHHEVEIKRLIAGDEEAVALIAALGSPVRAQRRQVNHLFDTDDRRLRRSRYVVRLRTEDDAAYLTAKGPGRRVGGDTVSRVEAEAAVDPGDVDELLAGRLEPLCVLRRSLPGHAYADLWRGLDAARACRPLRAAGSFENLRRVVDVTLPSGVELEVEIDRTQFPGGRVDSEIEIELPCDDLVAEVEQWLDDLARHAGIELRDSTPKTARFYEASA